MKSLMKNLPRLQAAALLLSVAFMANVSGTVYAAPALVDPAKQNVLSNQICPALANIKGQKLFGYCKDYRYQKDLDAAENKICSKYGSGKLKSQCAAYAVAKTPTVTPPPGSAPTTGCSATNCDLIATYINPAIKILGVLFGLIIVVSILLGSIQYITSEGDPQKASKAKNRITNSILAFFAYALLYGFLQFLIPGGVF